MPVIEGFAFDFGPLSADDARVTAAILRRSILLQDTIENLPVSSMKWFGIRLPYSGTLTVEVSDYIGQMLGAYFGDIRSERRFIDTAASVVAIHAFLVGGQPAVTGAWVRRLEPTTGVVHLAGLTTFGLVKPDSIYPEDLKVWQREIELADRARRAAHDVLIDSYKILTRSCRKHRGFGLSMEAKFPPDSERSLIGDLARIIRQGIEQASVLDEELHARLVK